jgi:Co/Zn/Cd efflux system component
MNKSTFIVSKMDCPSEEQVIRLAMQSNPAVSSLHFDIPKKTLEVLHTESYRDIFSILDSLNLNTTYIRSETISSVETTDVHSVQRRLLRQVLVINGVFFGLELAAGFLARSMGLLADSLDMLADAIVYGLSLYAVGHSIAKKKSVATLSGYFQLTLALLGFVEVVNRIFGTEEIPEFQLMIGISLLALLGNSATLYLLEKNKNAEAHIQASMICTSNDVIVNVGVIAAGLLVYFTHSGIPDLLIGATVFVLVSRGALTILKLGK